MVGKAKGRYYTDILGDIIQFLRSTSAATTYEIAEAIGVSWATSRKYLLKLLRDGIVVNRKRGTNTIWRLRDEA